MKRFAVKKFFSLAVAACFLAFTSLAWAAVVEMPDDYVEVTGIGEPDQSYSAGVRAAELVAFRMAAEAIDEFQLDSNSRVSEGRTQSDVINARLSTVLRRAKVVNEGKRADGYYFATVRVPMFGPRSVASAVFVPNEKTEPFPKPKFPQPVSAGSGGYTGLIVDCSERTLEKAMSPVIKDDAGQPIYGYKNLEYDKVVAQGMVAYSDSLTENVSRAGANPLVVKAVKVDGFDSLCDPVVSAADADRILSANAESHFLEKCAVVLVR